MCIGKRNSKEKEKDFNVSRSQTQLLDRQVQVQIIEDIVLIHKYAKPVISDQVMLVESYLKN